MKAYIYILITIAFRFVIGRILFTCFSKEVQCDDDAYELKFLMSHHISVKVSENVGRRITTYVVSLAGK